MENLENLDGLYFESRNLEEDWNESTYLAIAIGRCLKYSPVLQVLQVLVQLGSVDVGYPVR